MIPFSVNVLQLDTYTLLLVLSWESEQDVRDTHRCDDGALEVEVLMHNHMACTYMKTLEKDRSMNMLQ
tara:strand:- start:1063 stop:1266 length:204 start_codon:yes stop_codon:yes gene_type:complete